MSDRQTSWAARLFHDAPLLLGWAGVMLVLSIVLTGAASASTPIVVALDGSGDFTSVQAAIDSVPHGSPERAIIYIKNGVYEEKLSIPAGKMISLIGEDWEKTVLSYGDYAQKIGPTGQELGTSGSTSFKVSGNDFYAENLTVENSAGWGDGIGQAVALTIEGDRAVLYRVRVLGHQDTLYTPGEGRQYYKDCYVEGTVDFIFGSATAVFDECVIHSVDRGYVTAASTSPGKPYGYVFLNSTLTGEGRHDVYLGRPWRPYANVVYVNAWMGEHIRPEGWHNWNDPAREQTARYAEFNTTGPGKNDAARVPWSSQLTQEEAEQITPQSVLAGRDGWDPLEVIAAHAPYRGQPERPALTVAFNAPRADGRTTARGVFDVDIVVEAADQEALHEVVVTLDGQVVQAGRNPDDFRRIPVETRALADGRHDVAVEVRYADFPPLRRFASFIVANRWNLREAFRPPQDAGWFGVVDTLRASEKSDGWVYASDAPAAFFDDDGRLVRADGFEPWMVWETQVLQSVELIAYAQRGVDVANNLGFALSEDGETWRALPFVVEALDEEGEWIRVRVRSEFPAMERARWFRLALRGQAPAGSLQLGELSLAGVHGAD